MTFVTKFVCVQYSVKVSLSQSVLFIVLEVVLVE